MPATKPRSAVGPPSPRTCGRCRADFPGDAAFSQGREAGWWACDACRARLFGPSAQPADWRHVVAVAPAP